MPGARCSCAVMRQHITRMEPENTMLDNTSTPHNRSISLPASTFPALRVGAADLAEACTFLARVVEKRNSIPILDHVLFPGDGTVRGTNLDIAGIWTLDTNLCPGGHMPFTLPLAVLEKALKGADRGAVVTLSPASGVVVVEADGLRSEVAALPVEDFPIWPSAESASPGLLLGEHILGMKPALDWLTFVQGCISTEETRYYLGGVYVHCADSRVRAVATDGYRLAAQDFPGLRWTLPEGARDPGVIVPAKTVKALIGSIGKKPGAGDCLSMTLHQSRADFNAGKWRLVSKVIDYTFPDYSRVVPREINLHITAEAGPLLKAVTRLTGMADHGPVVLDGEAGTVSNGSGADSRNSIKVPMHSDNDGTVGVNPKYLTECIRALDTDDISIGYDCPGAPLLLTRGTAPAALDYSAGFRVCMPMRH